MINLKKKNLSSSKVFQEYSISMDLSSHVNDESMKTTSDYLFMEIDDGDLPQIRDGETLDDFNDLSKPSYWDTSIRMQSPSLIIANISYVDVDPSNASSKKTYVFTNSYLIYSNIGDGVRIMSYYIDQDSGFYYDKDEHMMTFNIDNDTIKTIDEKLYFDTNSIGISNAGNHGIGYVDTKYLDVRENGEVTLASYVASSIVDYKYKIKNIYNKMVDIYESASYLYNAFNEYQNTQLYANVKKITTTEDMDGKKYRSIVSYIYTYYFPTNYVKFYDDYYFNGTIFPKKAKKPLIELDGSRIIYCKNLEDLVILSYSTNLHKYFFDKNPEKYKMNKPSIYENFSYIIYDFDNEYNKFIINPYIGISQEYTENSDVYNCVHNRFKYISKSSDSKLFRRNGMILDQKFQKQTISYLFEDSIDQELNTINYSYNNIYYENDLPNTKIYLIYDNRDIKYGTFNNNEITSMYKNSNFIEDDSMQVPGFFSYILLTDRRISNLTKIAPWQFDTLYESNVITPCKDTTLYYGYNYVLHDDGTYSKKYYPIWQNLPISYISCEVIENFSKYEKLGGDINGLYCTKLDDMIYSDVGESSTLYIGQIYYPTNTNGIDPNAKINYLIDATVEINV